MDEKDEYKHLPIRIFSELAKELQTCDFKEPEETKCYQNFKDDSSLTGSCFWKPVVYIYSLRI